MQWPTILNPNRIVEFFCGEEEPKPTGEPSKERVNKRHEECSKNLRNSVLTFGAFAVICWAALSKQDIDLLSFQSVVKIGVVGIEVTLDNFLAVAPLTALVLLSHGAVFRLRLNRLDPAVADGARISTLFNLRGWWARLAAFFLHVLVPVALLVFLLVKTSNRESFQWNLLIIAIALIVVVAANLRFGRFNWAPITVTLCIAAGLIAAASYPPLEKILRAQILCWAPLDYREIVFRGRDVDLRGGRFHCANFTRADLSDADLSDADLSGADFGGADLTRANLTGANLTRANLTGAYLTRANLTGAYLTRVSFCGATIDGARLNPSDIGGPGHILCALTDDEWATIQAGRKGGDA